jgi:zeaxanthin glucosyltransferase
MKFGLLSLPLTGHFNPMTSLGRKLKSRGNEVFFIGVPDMETPVRAAGLDFVSFCEKAYPAGSVAKKWGLVAGLHGLDVMKYTTRYLVPELVKAALLHLPEKIRNAGVDGLLIDTTYRFIEVVPMHLGIPYIHIWNILHFDFSGSTPPPIYSWPHKTGPEAFARNVAGNEAVRDFFDTVRPVAQSFAIRNGLDIDWSDPTATISKLAVITQTPREFDFPIPNLPPHFHYAGPFHDGGGREPVPFPWEKLTGKPLVYASMGTLVNGLTGVYSILLKAAANFPDLQVVLSVGRNVDPADLGPVPPNTIVVRSAPQIELLKRSVLCITHAGLNTTLEALAQGVPMVAIPIGYEQPGIAARIAYHGVGELLEVGDLTEQRLLRLIRQTTTDPNYRERARWFQRNLAHADGLDLACEIVERTFGKHYSAKKTKEIPASFSLMGREQG